MQSVTPKQLATGVFVGKKKPPGSERKLCQQIGMSNRAFLFSNRLLSPAVSCLKFVFSDQTLKQWGRVQ